MLLLLLVVVVIAAAVVVVVVEVVVVVVVVFRVGIVILFISSTFVPEKESISIFLCFSPLLTEIVHVLAAAGGFVTKNDKFSLTL